jgi:hypothetical protein
VFALDGVTVKPATSSRIQPTTNARNIDVTVVWGSTVIGNHRIKDGERFTIGRSEGVTFKFTHPALSSSSFALVKFDGGHVQLASPAGLVRINDDETSSSDSLALGDVGRIVVGPLAFVVRHAKRSAAVASAFSSAVDFFYGKVLALVLIMHLAFVIGLMITPNLRSDDDSDLLNNQQKYTDIIAQAQAKRQPQVPKQVTEVTAKRSVSEGIIGKPAPQRSAEMSKPGAPNVDKNKRENDRTLVAKQLAALGLTSSVGAVSDVFGRAGTGINQALGNIKGAAMGDAGGFGMGTRGTQPGGPGHSVDIGRLSSSSGTCDDCSSLAQLSGGRKGGTRVSPGTIIHEDGLSKEEIQRVIGRAMNQIKYCYEKQLSSDPSLEGKLAMFWTITSNGDVKGVSAMQNTFHGKLAPALEQCVSGVLARLHFPSPKGGGVVNVTYPFNFAGSGN